MFLFEDTGERISHRRHALEFAPFHHDDLADSIRAAGLTIRDDSYQENGNFYAISATTAYYRLDPPGGPVMTATIRAIRPSDYRPVISVIDDWWGGRHMADMVPRLFFEHFCDTSFAAEHDGDLAGFLVGFRSQSRPAEAYIHFVGVRPGERGRGLGRQLYECFFAAVRARDCRLVRAVTSPVNSASVRFHQRLGFAIEPGDAQAGDVQVTAGYDGAGQDRVRFIKHLT